MRIIERLRSNFGAPSVSPEVSLHPVGSEEGPRRRELHVAVPDGDTIAFPLPDRLPGVDGLRIHIDRSGRVELSRRRRIFGRATLLAVVPRPGKGVWRYTYRDSLAAYAASLEDGRTVRRFATQPPTAEQEERMNVSSHSSRSSSPGPSASRVASTSGTVPLREALLREMDGLVPRLHPDAIEAPNAVRANAAAVIAHTETTLPRFERAIRPFVAAVDDVHRRYGEALANISHVPAPRDASTELITRRRYAGVGSRAGQNLLALAGGAHGNEAQFARAQRPFLEAMIATHDALRQIGEHTDALHAELDGIGKDYVGGIRRLTSSAASSSPVASGERSGSVALPASRRGSRPASERP